MMIQMRPSAFVSQILNKARMSWTFAGTNVSAAHKKGDEVVLTIAAGASNAASEYGFTSTYGQLASGDYKFSCSGIDTFPATNYKGGGIIFGSDSNNRQQSVHVMGAAGAGQYRQHYVGIGGVQKVNENTTSDTVARRQYSISRIGTTYTAKYALSTSGALSSFGAGVAAAGMPGGKLGLMVYNSGTAAGGSITLFKPRFNSD